MQNNNSKIETRITVRASAEEKAALMEASALSGFTATTIVLNAVRKAVREINKQHAKNPNDLITI